MAASWRTEVERIQHQLQAACEGPAWHGPAVFEILDGISAAQAARSSSGTHSIWEIVLHMTAWHNEVRKRLDSPALAMPDAVDWPTVTDTSEVAWQTTRDALTHSYEALREAIALLTDARLEDSVPGKPHSVYVMLHGAIQHTLYHAGQIILLKKQRS